AVRRPGTERDPLHLPAKFLYRLRLRDGARILPAFRMRVGRDVPLALWWPDADILLTSSHGLLRQYGWEQAFGLLLRALSEHFDAVAMYLRSPSTGVATMTFISHIGHHLWNELSGLDQAMDETPLWASRVYVCHAETSEHFGEIE